MKTTVFTLALSLMCSLAFAQIPSSTWMITGGISYQNDQFTDYGYYALGNDYIELQNSISSFATRVGLGYTFAENQIVGLELGYDVDRSVDEDLIFGTDEIETFTTTDTRFMLAPFYRYYYFCAPSLAFIGQVSVPIVMTGGKTEVEGPNPASVEDPSGFGIGVWLTPKLAWFPKDNWSLEAGVGRLGYYTEGYDDPNNNRIKNSSLEATLWMFQPSLSISYYFNRNEKL